MSALDTIDVTDVRWADWADDPYPLYRTLRDHRPVYHDEANRMFVLTRYADIFGVLRDHARFSNIPVFVVDGTGVRTGPLREEDQPRHTFLRRILAPLFTPAAMRRMEPYFVALAKQLLDDAERAEIVDVSEQLAKPLPGRVTCDLLGLPVELHARFHRLTEIRLALLGQLEGRVDTKADLGDLAQVREAQWEILEPLLAERRSDPRMDAISLLAQAQEAEGGETIDDDLIVDLLLHLLTGGFHTTQHLVENLFDLLADRPDLWQRLRDDRALVPGAIEEMLRFDAPVQALRRRTLEPVEVDGTPIPGNYHVAVVYGSANRDERMFEDPDTYRPERDLKRQLAFSAGIHYCPGAPVSRFEVRALVDEMLDRYETIERAGPSVRTPSPPDRRSVDLMRGHSQVPVRLRRGA